MGRSSARGASSGRTPSGSVREAAANLLLGRALQVLDGACGMVVYRDAEGRWQWDRLTLPERPDRLDQLSPVAEALLEWTLHAERPAVVDDLRRSPWSRYLLGGAEPPAGSMAATPIAQWGTIWGALAIYRVAPPAEPMEVLRRLAELATEPLSALGSLRP